MDGCPGTAADGVVHGVELKYEDEARVRAGRLGCLNGCLSPESETRDGGRCSLNDFKPGQAAGVNCYVYLLYALERRIK